MRSNALGPPCSMAVSDWLLVQAQKLGTACDLAPGTYTSPACVVHSPRPWWAASPRGTAWLVPCQAKILPTAWSVTSGPCNKQTRVWKVFDPGV